MVLNVSLTDIRLCFLLVLTVTIISPFIHVKDCAAQYYSRQDDENIQAVTVNSLNTALEFSFEYEDEKD